MGNLLSYIESPYDSLPEDLSPVDPRMQPTRQSRETQTDTFETPASLADEPAPVESKLEPTLPSCENQTAYFKRPTCYAELPPRIWIQIFQAVPAKERLVVAGVCRSWRHLFLETSSCWAGIQLGRYPNCFSIMSLATRSADFLPLSHIRDVKMVPAKPASVPVSKQSKEIPFLLLSCILGHARELKSLDLHLLSVTDENVADFR